MSATATHEATTTYNAAANTVQTLYAEVIERATNDFHGDEDAAYEAMGPEWATRWAAALTARDEAREEIALLRRSGTFITFATAAEARKAMAAEMAEDRAAAIGEHERDYGC